MNRKALGKGIEALIPSFENSTSESEDTNGSVDLLIDEIVPNRLQPRKHFNDEQLEELENSIREHGVIQPVIVRAESLHVLLLNFQALPVVRH